MEAVVAQGDRDWRIYKHVRSIWVRLGDFLLACCTRSTVEVILIIVKQLEAEDSCQVVHLLEATWQGADILETLPDQLSRQEPMNDLVELLY